MSEFANKMLLATDGSPGAESAARMAIALSNGLNLELHVVCVGHAPSVYTGSETEFLDPEFQNWLREGARSDARAKLEELAQRIKEMGGEVAQTHAAVGRPDAEIVHIAEELGAGLIVVGSRGLGAMQRMRLGSVSTNQSPLPKARHRTPRRNACELWAELTLVFLELLDFEAHDLPALLADDLRARQAVGPVVLSLPSAPERGLLLRELFLPTYRAGEGYVPLA